jgi:hypothetical protein
MAPAVDAATAVLACRTSGWWLDRSDRATELVQDPSSTPAERSSHRLDVDVPRGEAEAMHALVLVGMDSTKVREREPVREDRERGDGALNAISRRHSPPSSTMPHRDST